jgi:hypothetical protein
VTRVLILGGLLVSAAIVAADQFSRGYPIGGTLLAGTILAGGVHWIYRTRTQPDAGVDPWIFLWLAVIVASQARLFDE